MSSKTITNLIIIAVVLVIVYFGYQYFTSSNTEQSSMGAISVVAVGSSDLATSSPADEFRQLLASISSVDFQGDHSIFTDQIFTGALDDFSQPLPSIDAERDNPFAPLGKDALGAHHSATSSSINMFTGSSTNRTPTSTKRPLPSSKLATSTKP